MLVSIVGRNDLTCRKVMVDQDMVMSGAFNNLASRFDFHSLHSHDHLYGPFDLRTVFGFRKEHSALGFLLPHPTSNRSIIMQTADKFN